MLDTAPQVFKHGEGFAFVFLFRIFLGIAAQVDALAQVVHGGKVFAPLQVDDLQHDVAFEIRHRFLPTSSTLAAYSSSTRLIRRSLMS